MTTLVTGSAGFIGFHASRALLARGEKVIGIDNFNDYYDPELKEARNKILEQHEGYTLHRIDLCNQDALAKVLASSAPDRVLHLAAQAGVRYSIEEPVQFIRTNLEGSVNLFEAMRQHQINHVVFASSSSVYGANPVPWSESQPVDQPLNVYGVTKRGLELLAYTYHHLYGMNATGLRFFTVYGPWGRPDMAYFKFAKKIKNNEPIELYNYGKQRRDFTYIDDIVSGILAALDNPKPYAIYNLGNSKSEELEKFVSLIEQNLGKTVEKKLVPLQPGEFVENFADITKAEHDLNFSPKTSIEEGLAQFVAWFKEYYK